MNVPAFERLSAEEKQALLGGLRQRPKVSEAPAKPTGSIRTSGSFGSLPAMMELKTQRAMGTMLGLANPFYREHGEKAGAWSRIADQEVANFASYDYLGLNGHPDITEQVAKSLELWGTSVSASPSGLLVQIAVAKPASRRCRTASAAPGYRRVWVSIPSA